MVLGSIHTNAVCTAKCQKCASEHRTALYTVQWLDEPLLDSSRESGMAEEAEEEVKIYSGVEGEIHLVSWDKAKCRVLSMTYQEGKYLVSTKQMIRIPEHGQFTGRPGIIKTNNRRGFRLV